MGISDMLNKIKSFLRKSRGDGLQVLGRTSTENESLSDNGELLEDYLPENNRRDALGKVKAEDDFNQQTISTYKKRLNTNSVHHDLLDAAEIEDDELPSVNKRVSKGKFPPALMFLSLFVFAFLLYAMFSTPSPAPVITSTPAATTVAATPPAEERVMNQMPPLVMPAPPAPIEPVSEVPPATITTTPIPLQAAPVVAKPIVIEDPDWVIRKVNSGVLIDTKGKEIPTTQQDAQSSKAKDAKDTKDAKSSKDVKSSDENGMTAQGELSRNLKPLVEAKGVSASILPNRNFMIAKGTLLDCALETAIDSSLAGLITCRLTRDVYSDNGRVIMLDRGSQLVGEYKSGMAEGIVRIFVLWTRAKTPKGVVINLDSPGTDALGRSGLEGFVDTHFMERFGTAIMMSLVQESFDYAKAKAASVNANNSTVSTSSGGNNTILNRLATEQMRKSMTIPPVLYINQGANVQVMVVRDLDFSTVYGIEEKE